MQERRYIIRDAVGFLTDRGMRPKALALVGGPGIGKTTLLDQIQVEALAAGRHDVVVVDDAHLLSDDEIGSLRERLLMDTRQLLLVAHDGSNPTLTRMIDSSFDRRVFTVGPLSDAESRELLTELGVQPHSLHAGALLRECGGVPRLLIDRSSGRLDVEALVRDMQPGNEQWCDNAAARIRLVLAEDIETLERFVDRLRVVSGDDDVDVVERFDADAALSEIALIEGDLERTIQLGERVAAADDAPERLRIFASSNASAARALRGEPTAMLSLHALAGRASRARLPLVEAYVWYGIAFCAGILGDVTTSERAAVRSIQIYDAHGELALALRGRQILADLHVAASRVEAASAYFEELRLVAESQGLHRLLINSSIGEARALLITGEFERATVLCDEAVELVMRMSVSRNDVVEVSVIAARAYAATGSVDLALAPLQALAVDLGDSHSPDFWLVLEAIRVLGKAGTDPAAFKIWLARMAEFDADGHGGALRAAHAEADAWRAAIEGRKAEAARLAERARQLWVAAECHDELPLTEPIIQQAPLEHGPRISLVGGAAVAPAEDPEAFEVLTKREREIARYVAGGLTNPEIAGELHLSPRTVEHHVASILRKLELPNRRALVRGQV